MGVAALVAVTGVMAQDPPLPRPRPAAGLQQPAAAAPATPDNPGSATSVHPSEPLPSVIAESSGDGDIGVSPLSPDGARTASDAATALALPPVPVALRAVVTGDGPPITDGLVWRVFNADADESGQLVMVAKSESANPRLELPPGDYVVDVAFGFAQASDNLEIGKSGADKTVVVDAGGLRLNAAVSGDIKIPPSLLHFDVYQADVSDRQAETARNLVARGVGPNRILTLNAGTYHIVSYFGEVNAKVKADLHIVAGKLTDATLYHKAAQVSFKLISSPGGEAIADVDWVVKTRDGNAVFSETGTFPATVLAAGDYMVFAKRGSTVYNRDFQVQAGPPESVEVLTTVVSPDAGG